MKRFIDGDIALWCETPEEAEAVLRLCEKYKLIHTAPKDWAFPLSELPVEVAVGYPHPFLISFSYLYGSHRNMNGKKKWKPVLANDFLEGINNADLS
jgi:hypothetical protein